MTQDERLVELFDIRTRTQDEIDKIVYPDMVSCECPWCGAIIDEDTIVDCFGYVNDEPLYDYERLDSHITHEIKCKFCDNPIRVHAFHHEENRLGFTKP